MKPCVVIATHQRFEITCKTITLLLQHPVTPWVVLVCSDMNEQHAYRSAFPEHHVKIVLTNNNPLGAKWQAGVDRARQLNPSAVIIQGSDDVLSRGFIMQVEQAIHLGNDFVGLQNWWIWDNKTLYRFDYMKGKDFPLGGGRFYSKNLLDKMDWKVFDTSRNSCLDDYGWHEAKKKGKVMIYRANSIFNILAVKGNWPVMNKLETTLNHPNAKLIENYTGLAAKTLLKNIFNYG